MTLNRRLGRFVPAAVGIALSATLLAGGEAPLPPDTLAPAEPAKTAFPVECTFNPVKPNLQLVVDSSFLPRPEEVKRVSYTIVRQADGEAINRGIIDRPVTNHFRKLVELSPGLAPGEYTLSATLLLKDGTSLGPETVAFTKLDEAKSFAAWWNTRLGSTERVIRPFTPLARDGNRVACRGREYALNALGLPERVMSQGRDVSAGPARIVIRSNGREESVPLRGKPDFTETRAWRVAFAGEAKGGGVRFTSTGWVEQDGMVQVSLTLTPAGKAGVPVDALRLEFPLRNEEADVFLCQGAGGNYAAGTTMLVPPDKQGVLWTTRDTGTNGSGMTVGSFYPELWVGNEQRGFMWYADNDCGWVQDDAVPAHDLLRSGGDLILRNHLIAKPFTLDAPRTITFTYMASPFRPLVEGRRATLYSEDCTFAGANIWKTPDKTVTDYFGPEWLNDSWNATEQDYFLYICDRAFGEGGLRTIYGDLFFLHLSDSVQSGLAYVLPDGRVQPGYNALNLRRFLMRLCALMEAHGLIPGAQVAHARNGYCLPASAWMDVRLDGVFNYDRKQATDAVSKIGLDTLGLVPQLPWQEFVGVRDLEKGANEPASALDFHNRPLTVPALAPHTGRLIGIRRY